ncbi:protein prenylyltransferase [Jaminaea rosea]|uniref:Protein farnesyltransferase/geranylgeranyltransferase type-1 subunit alpha n=1 Tax=Jaminaea rosea TaxID=1569628 RepID=A0A316UMY8_9BASI|nr:protein prenylyltransferase [Jaminaea rosea]PWN26626.1 protein prenylyltransferase [Jaminaea rosea]
MTMGSSSEATFLAHECERPYLPFDPSSSHWADVVPTLQDDGPSPDVLVPIMYDPAYSSAMDLLRTMQPKREFSDRALALTTHLVSLNPSSYTVWAYRADVLLEGQEGGEEKRKKLRRELDWMEELARGNMKSYQVWQHRRMILSALGDPSTELSFIESVLNKDSKNYHTWAYRQWVLAQYGGLPSGSARDKPTHPELWEGEVGYTTKLIDEDVRNNSAWNHRFFVIFGSGRAAAGPKAIGLQSPAGSDAPKDGLLQCAEAEVRYTRSQLSIAPSNAAAWAYLRGVLSHVNQPLTSYDLQPFVRNLGDEVAHALEYRLDIVEEQLLEGREAPEIGMMDQLVEKLVEVDPVRRRWWQARREEIQELTKAPAPAPAPASGA